MKTAVKSMIHTKNFFTNPLLSRRQCVIDVTHPGSACLKNSEIKEKIAAKYKVADPQTIFLFGFKTKFGGGKTRGYCCIYDTLQDAKKFSPLHMLVRQGLKKKINKPRKQRKEKKNRAKKVHSAEKAKILHKKEEK